MSFTDTQKRAFKDAKAMDFEQLPDGEYQAILDKSQVKKFMSNQKVERKVMLTYKIFSPDEHDGKAYNQFLSLDNQNAYGVLKSVLRRFGCNPEEMNIEDVEAAFDAAVGLEVHFTLETRGQYQNPFVTAVRKQAERKEAAPIDIDGQDIPFAVLLPLFTSGFLAWTIFA